jgi:hypothetical protein
MDVGSSGGGYFYGPFTTTQILGPYTLIPNPGAGVYGAWIHVLGPLTNKARWMQIVAWPAGYGSVYQFQIAIGAAGGETIIQPTPLLGGSGFYVDWNAVIKWPVPYVQFFPGSVRAQQEISLRTASTPGGGLAVQALIYLWN